MQGQVSTFNIKVFYPFPLKARVIGGEVAEEDLDRVIETILKCSEKSKKHTNK
jgi:hypothetical protein